MKYFGSEAGIELTVNFKKRDKQLQFRAQDELQELLSPSSFHLYFIDPIIQKPDTYKTKQEKTDPYQGDANNTPRQHRPITDTPLIPNQIILFQFIRPLSG